jgi:hypothetical protein
MLKPAILYKDQIEKYFREIYYTEDMLFETGCCNENWTPNISDNTSNDMFQFAIVDSENECVGYISFRVDWYASNAYNFGLISFDRGNFLVGKALQEVMNKLIYEFKVHRIEWRMVGGNPVERHYDKFCSKYNGTKHILHDVIKDVSGNYHDNIIYEIILDNINNDTKVDNNESNENRYKRIKVNGVYHPLYKNSL